jgi:hypothetical protein
MHLLSDRGCSSIPAKNQPGMFHLLVFHIHDFLGLSLHQVRLQKDHSCAISSPIQFQGHLLPWVRRSWDA